MLKISQPTVAEPLVDEYGIGFGRSVPLPVGTKLAEFDKKEAPGDWPCRVLVGSLMWLSTQTWPDISNAVEQWLGTALSQSCCTGGQHLVFQGM